MQALIPLIIVFAGLAAGAGAGWFMRPAPPPQSADPAGAPAPESNGAATGAASASTAGQASGDGETLQLSNQFLVPLVSEDGVRAVVVIGLALELAAGHQVSLARHEARLRAGFLQALFDHANMGGFEGVFTSGEVLLSLRRQLRGIAREKLGAAVQDVLITDLMRQES